MLLKVMCAGAAQLTLVLHIAGSVGSRWFPGKPSLPDRGDG
jgi:hypothetical protein